jgi:hypothetical protein
MNDDEPRIEALEDARKELEDSLIVMTRLEIKQSNVVRLQAEETEKLRAQMDEQRKLNVETDRRIASLVSAVGQLITKMPPPEAHR